MGLDLFGLPVPSYDMATPRGVASLIVAVLAVGASLHVAAKAIAKKSDPWRALCAGGLGLLCAHLAFLLASPVPLVGFFASLATFALVAAAVYRKRFAEGVALGAIAWAIWLVASIALGYVLEHWH